MPSGIYPRTLEHNAKISASAKIVQNYSEVRAKQIETRRKNGMPWHSEETKQKMRKPKSEKAKANIKAATTRPEVKAKRVETRRKNGEPWFSEATRVNMKEAAGRPEVRARRKNLWADPEWKKKQLKAIFKGLRLLPNKPEKFLDKLFQQLFLNQIKYTGDGKDEDSIVAGRCPDFIFTDGQKKIIEHFGDFHHGEGRTGIPNEQHEQERINLFARYGYQTLVIWEHELEDIDILQKKIFEFVTI